jgi:hypothetical protein
MSSGKDNSSVAGLCEAGASTTEVTDLSHRIQTQGMQSLGFDLAHAGAAPSGMLVSVTIGAGLPLPLPKK